MASLRLLICVASCEPSLEVTEQEITGRDTPQARPSATLDGTKMYGTFCARWCGAQNNQSLRVGLPRSWRCPNTRPPAPYRTLSSQSSGRWSRMARGSVSAASTMNSEMPRFNVLVAGERKTEVV